MNQRHLLAGSSVKSRIESTQGISFTEFSYQLLQAYDFWYLYQNHECRVQVSMITTLALKVVLTPFNSS